jgi:hypothetical protein
MIDLESTRQMICLDNLPPHEIASLISAHGEPEEIHSLNAQKDAILTSRNTAILPGAINVTESTAA